MGRNLDALRRAGAVQAIAQEFRRCGCWDKTTEFAKREFRDCSPQTVKACVNRARLAVDLADRMNSEHPDTEFNESEERRKQQ